MELAGGPQARKRGPEALRVQYDQVCQLLARTLGAATGVLRPLARIGS